VADVANYLLCAAACGYNVSIQDVQKVIEFIRTDEETISFYEKTVPDFARYGMPIEQVPIAAVYGFNRFVGSSVAYYTHFLSEQAIITLILNGACIIIRGRFLYKKPGGSFVNKQSVISIVGMRYDDILSPCRAAPLKGNKVLVYKLIDMEHRYDQSYGVKNGHVVDIKPEDLYQSLQGVSNGRAEAAVVVRSCER
jgi:hypothetical protein